MCVNGWIPVATTNTGYRRQQSIERIGLGQIPGQIPIVGSRPFIAQGIHNIVVEAPGELARSKIARQGHMGIRYDVVPEWT